MHPSAPADIDSLTGPDCVPPREEGRPARGADGGVGHQVGQPGALAAQPVDVGRPGGAVSEAPDVADAQVVGQKHHEVGTADADPSGGSGVVFAPAAATAAAAAAAAADDDRTGGGRQHQVEEDHVSIDWYAMAATQHLKGIVVFRL